MKIINFLIEITFFSSYNIFEYSNLGRLIRSIVDEKKLHTNFAKKNIKKITHNFPVLKICIMLLFFSNCYLR